MHGEQEHEEAEQCEHRLKPAERDDHDLDREPPEQDARGGDGRADHRGRVVTATPRPGLRDVAPYVSPQLTVTARLNTNECPLPLPVGFSDDLAAAVRDLELNRYPDGQMSDLREALAARTGHEVDGVWTANGSNEILTQLLTAYGGAGRRAALFEPTYLLHRRLCWLTQTEIVERRLGPPFEIDADAAAWAGGKAPTWCSCARRTTRPATRSRPRRSGRWLRTRKGS